MKRILAMMLSLALVFTMVLPTTAFAGTMLKDYDSVSIIIPPAAIYLEDSFREFVKGVSNEYYRSPYDYNTYYYNASQVKEDWDKGGFWFWSRKDDPYSTQSNDQYSIATLQSMLIKGIQQKAEEIKSKEYSYGISVNPVTGDWEVNKEAVIAQNIYNTELESAIEQAKNKLTMDFANAGIDLVAVVLTKGVTPELFGQIVDAITESVTNAWNTYTELRYENIKETLKNQYSIVMKEAIVQMYNNIDEQLLSDYRQLYEELCNGNYDGYDDEEELRDQLKILLDSIDRAKIAGGSDIVKAVDAVAEEMVSEIGLEKQVLLSEDEIMIQVFSELVRSTFSEVVKMIIDICFNDINGQWYKILAEEVSKETLKELADTAITDVLKNDPIPIIDYNGDGYDEGDIIRNLCDFIFDGRELDNILQGLFKSLVVKLGVEKISAIDDLQEQANNATNQWSNAWAELKKAKFSDDPIYEGQMVEIERKASEKMHDANDKLKKMKGVGILVDDICKITVDTLNLAFESAGLGDQADGEVFYAYIALSMYKAKQNAEKRRESLGSTYKSFSNTSYIDTADIDSLKKFVNRVYAVYETDMLGHTYYVSLDAGWHYQNGGQKFEEAMAEFRGQQERVNEEYGGFMGAFWNVYAPLYAWVGAQKSEYLKEVNKKYEWLDYDDACSVYTTIAGYASRARIPAQFKQIGK